MATKSKDLSSVLLLQVIQRNRREVSPFEGCYEALRATRAEHRAILQRHAEMRADVGVILQEYVSEQFKSLEHSPYEPVYSRVKERLMSLHSSFSSFRRDSEILQARLELVDTIKANKEELATKQSKLEELEVRNAQLLQEIGSLKGTVEDSRAQKETIVGELENVRRLLDVAEARARNFENQNAELLCRFIDEKERMAAEMNEMNNVVEGMKGFVGGGLSFLKSLKSSVLPSDAGKPVAAAKASDLDEEFEIVGDNGDAKAAKQREERGSIGGAIVSIAALDGMTSKTEPLSEAGETATDGALPEGLVLSVGSPKEPAWVEKCHATEINDLCSDGRFLVTAGSDSVVKVYSLSSREMKFSFMSTGPSLSVDLVDEEWVIAACAASRSECRVWSLKTGRQRVNFGGHANKILCVRFIGPNKVVTASADRSLKIWDISHSSSNPIHGITTNSSAESVGLSPHMNTMASGHQDGGVRVWDVNTGEKVSFMAKVHGQHVSCVQFHPRNGHELLACSRDSNGVKIIDTRTYEEVKYLKIPGGHKMGSMRVSFSPDGSSICAGTTDGGLVVWNVGTGAVQSTVKGEEVGHRSSGVSAVDWSAAGVTSADKAGSVVLWRT